MKTYKFPLETNGQAGIESGPLIGQAGQVVTWYGRTRTPFGRVIVWLGSFTILALIFLFAGIEAGAGTDKHNQHIGRIFGSIAISFLIYVGLDVPYVLLIERPCFQTPLYAYHGTDQIYTVQRPDGLPRLWYITFPAVFLLASLAITFLAVLPSLEFLDYWKCASRGWLLGAWAYGNLSLVQIWSMPRFPLELAVIQTLWGSFLCFIVSLATTGFVQFLENGELSPSANV